MSKEDKEYANPRLIEHAREMRSNMPQAEVLLWSRLRRQATRHRFRRQHPIGSYIADFACVAAHVVIELDGLSHDERGDYDSERDAHLRDRGWQVLRYWNMDVLKHIDAVVEDIVAHCDPQAPT